MGGLAAVVRAAAAAAGKPVPSGVREAAVTDAHRALAAALGHGQRRAIFLGALAQRHPAYAEISALARRSRGAVAARAWVSSPRAPMPPARILPAPCRIANRAARRSPPPGLSARAMLESRLKAYVLFGGIDPANDLAGPTDALAGADLVIAATTHLTEKLREAAHVVLPIGTFAESAGTFVNVEGRWQSWTGAASAGGREPAGLEGAARARRTC